MTGSPERRVGTLETRWRQVLERAPEVYLAVDAAGDVVDCNRAAARLFGLDKAQVARTPVGRLVIESERDGFGDGLRAAMACRGADAGAVFEVRMTSAAGAAFIAEYLVWGVDRRGGTLAHCFVRDVTARRESEQSAALLAAVVDGSADAVITEDPDHRVVTWNAAAERMYGWTAEQAVGGSSLLIVPEDQEAEHLRLVADVLAGEPVRAAEGERVSRGGVRVPVSLRFSPVHDPDGRVAAVSTIAHDITERRWMAETLDHTLQQLQAAVAEARSSEDSCRRFLADAAHQLRTPLAGIRACAELLLLGTGTAADRDRVLATMVRETSRSARLITALLTMARLDQGEDLPEGSVDLVPVCADEVERLSLLAPELEVALEVRGTPPPRLPLDAASCQEILSNLGDNARRHARTRVTFSVQSTSTSVAVRVSDDGDGIAEADRERVFERFVSLDHRGGSGLGLPIARGLARALGGDLDYADGFVLSLPTATATSSD